MQDKFYEHICKKCNSRTVIRLFDPRCPVCEKKYPDIWAKFMK